VEIDVGLIVDSHPMKIDPPSSPQNPTLEIERSGFFQRLME